MKRFGFLLFTFFIAFPSFSQDSSGLQRFRVSDILIDGHQRVSRGVIFSAFPIRVGDTVTQRNLSEAVRELFKTGFFDDVELAREGDVLIVRVQELPAISEIEIDGNKAIKTDDLMKSLEENGLSEGQIFKRATLEGLAQSLEREYVNQGRYNSSVKTEVKKLPRNQVKISLEVDEGKEARIKHINIVGNNEFDDDQLKDLFEIKTTGWFSWLSGNDKYSREKLTGDIERLESFYLDRGYLDFSISSAPISISPDKEAIYVTINVTEGDVYTVSDIKLAGDPILPEEEIRQFIVMKEDQTFSQLLMTTSSDFITQRLGNDGYTFAETRGIPEQDKENKTVTVTFFVDPGKRAYVRRIEFRGNTQTVDEVLRREMRQMEGASASTAKIEQSKVRLERLGFFKGVEVDTVEVPGTLDQVDVEFTVEEQPSGSVGFQVGYSDGFGAVIGANITNANWFGTGKSVGFAVNHNRYQSSANFNYTDPYFTPDGVSRGFGLYYTKSDYEEFNISSFNTDRYGATLSFGYPLSENSQVGFSLGYENLVVDPGSYSSQEIKGSPELFAENALTRQYYLNSEYQQWVLDYAAYQEALQTDPAAVAPSLPAATAFLENDPIVQETPEGFLDRNGTEFDTFTMTFSWIQNALNRGVLATRGYRQQLSLELSVPGGDLEYYKLRYQGQYFRPLTKNLTLRLKTELGYADSYGDTDGVPFFENFYAGGFDSVRGFERNTLGPRSTPPEQYIAQTPTGGTSGYLLCDTPAVNSGCATSTGQLASVVTGRSDRAFGGNILVEASAEIIFPLPFIKDQRSVQSAFFVDAGNVFSSECGVGQLNCLEDITWKGLSSSYGVGLTWISGFGPLRFSVARPINEQLYDETEFFQFTLGTSF
ncbi:MAG: outer membrane protein assembly factor BamA [Cellvibrionaceae bacterium]